MRNLRRTSQGVFLLGFIFLFLQTESKGADDLGYPVKLFLDFDPLILISSFLSSHSVQKAFYLSLIVIIMTVLLGRVFCGWICPLGTLNNIMSSISKKSRRHVSLKWSKSKYYILIFFIISSLFSLQITGIMDPVSLLIRSFSLSIYPLFNYATRAMFDTIYNTGPSSLVDVSESVYSGLKQTVLSFKQPYFYQSVFTGLIFISILGLNFYERRFWCRNLCPLGALLGLLSRYAILTRSVSEGCNECGACAEVCQGHASPDVKNEWKKAECMYCWNCDDICPNNAVILGVGKNSSSYSTGSNTNAGINLGRRGLVTSIMSGVVIVPLIRSTPFLNAGASAPDLIRPPGALPEKEFLKRCIKCGECMKVCITNGLQPTLMEAGLEGIWSPVLVPRLGYCEYRCTLCGQVCPTGAIQTLSIEKKIDVKIGLAMIDKGRCLPYAHATPCIVCEEVCPTSKKAVWLQKAAVKNRRGDEIIVQQPRVDLKLCIGCGICEAKCPVKNRPAIYVTSTGESRSLDNRLLLNQ